MPWPTPELQEAVKRQNALRRTITDNRAEYLDACASIRKLSEEARQKELGGIPGRPRKQL